MITLAHQTIHDTKPSVSPVAGEVLVRWVSSGQVTGPASIQQSSELNWGQIDEQVLSAVLNNQYLMGRTTPLFINVSDVTLSSCEMLSNYCHLLGQIVRRYKGTVVVEVPETSPLTGRALEMCLSQFRMAGAKVAIDDFGVEHADMSRLDGHEWDYCKLALPSVAYTPTLDWLITLQQKCRDRDIQVVCEQIERISDLELIRIFPTAWAQGFAYAMPEMLIEPANDFRDSKCANF
ncbi:EAL domain-containing protein [Pseudomonas aeruginosa]